MIRAEKKTNELNLWEAAAIAAGIAAQRSEDPRCSNSEDGRLLARTHATAIFVQLPIEKLRDLLLEDLRIHGWTVPENGTWLMDG